METKFCSGVDFSRVSFSPWRGFLIDAGFENSAILGLRTLRTPKFGPPEENSWGVRIFGAARGRRPAGRPGRRPPNKYIFWGFHDFFRPHFCTPIFRILAGVPKIGLRAPKFGVPEGGTRDPSGPPLFLAPEDFFRNFVCFFPKFLEFLLFFNFLKFFFIFIILFEIVWIFIFEKLKN